jgi:hypothetical protein
MRRPATNSTHETSHQDRTRFARRQRPWTGDVELLPSGKRPDYTTFYVDLWVDGDAVVLHGSESEQEYLEVFAIADGKRLLSVLRAR